LTDVAGRGWRRVPGGAFPATRSRRRVPGDAFPAVRGDRLPAPELDYMSA
jgi:hypothetical protein